MHTSMYQQTAELGLAALLKILKTARASIAMAFAALWRSLHVLHNCSVVSIIVRQS